MEANLCCLTLAFYTNLMYRCFLVCIPPVILADYPLLSAIIRVHSTLYEWSEYRLFIGYESTILAAHNYKTWCD